MEDHKLDKIEYSYYLYNFIKVYYQHKYEFQNHTSEEKMLMVDSRQLLIHHQQFIITMVNYIHNLLYYRPLLSIMLVLLHILNSYHLNLLE